MELTVSRQIIWIVCCSTTGLQLSACIGAGCDSIGTEEAVHVRDSIFSGVLDRVNVLVHERIIVDVGLSVGVSHSGNYAAG